MVLVYDHFVPYGPQSTSKACNPTNCAATLFINVFLLPVNNSSYTHAATQAIDAGSSARVTVHAQLLRSTSLVTLQHAFDGACLANLSAWL